MKGSLTHAQLYLVTQVEFEQWCESWKNSLVINVLGKQISFRMIENKIQCEWVRVGVVKIVDMPHDFFLLQFAVEGRL